MLDRKPAVITAHFQPVAELPPPFLTMAKSKGNVGPAAPRNIHQAAVFQQAGGGLLRGVQERVFGVDVIDGLAQRLGGAQGVGTHPEQVAGVKVGAHNRPDLGPQFQEGRHVIDDLIAVQFQRDLLNTGRLRQRNDLGPERKEFLLPLIAKDGLRFGRPAGDNPVGHQVARTAFGQARHGADLPDAHFPRQTDGVAQADALFGVGRMQRVAVGVQGDHLKAPVGKRPEKTAALACIGLHRGEVEMRCGRPAAGIDLDPLHTQAGGMVEHGVEGQAAQTVRYKAEFHGVVLQSL